MAQIVKESTFFIETSNRKKTFWFKICTLHPYTKSGLICKHVIHEQKFLAVVAETLATTISQLKFSIRNSRFSFENVVVFITTQMCQFIHHFNAFLRERKTIHKKNAGEKSNEKENKFKSLPFTIYLMMARFKK